MSLQTTLWSCFEWSAELYMLRDSIDRAPKTSHPVSCFIGETRFEITWKARWKQVVIVVWVGNIEIQTFRINHNTIPGLLITTGKPGINSDDITKCLPVRKQIQWFYKEDGGIIFHNLPLVDELDQSLPGAYLSNIGFMRMMLRIFPWLE